MCSASIREKVVRDANESTDKEWSQLSTLQLPVKWWQIETAAGEEGGGMCHDFFKAHSQSPLADDDNINNKLVSLK